MRALKVAAAIAAAMLVMAEGSTGADAAVTHALIDGSGSSWAANAINQWVADVGSQGMQVVFTANGSAQGRKDYANRTTDFGVSDIPYQGADPTTGQPDNSQHRSFAYLPVAAGGTSFPYHIQVGNSLVRNLRLSGLTLAKIFTDKITNWDDPEITADNNGRKLPSIPIIPVVHSEGAGTTAMFTEYLAREYPSVWGPCNGGKATETEYFPLNCGKSSGPQRAQSGSDGVMNFISNADANGSIGVEEYSYALLANIPAAKILNKAGYYTLPTQYNVAVALTKAQINNDKSSPNYLTQNLNNVYVNSDKRTYPLSSYVYAIIPTAANDSRMTTPKRQTIADFLYYSICRGQGEIGRIGYSSLPVNLVEAGFGQIGRLKTADPGVDLTQRAVSTCDNPTFIAGHPEENHLAVVAPEPPACDERGAGPCSANVGSFNGAPSEAGSAGASNAAAGGHAGGSGSSGGSAGSGGTTGTAAAGSGTTAISGPSAAPSGNGAQIVVDPVTGQTQAAGPPLLSTDPTVVPTTLASSDRSGPNSVLWAVLAVVILLLIVSVPGAYVIGTRRAGRAQ
ncbi:substrate-binding domain-containing protein [Jatrophihabitans sp.]|uniref:substrate-binding domain-containing protein n=1 Tax=Jatrophihabitans sp. TaxID=1932789 RepID=UPI0030C6B1A0|nr:phosphate transporter substrate-binding protein PhoT family [Jatrophihabitans sp.]